jgi:hypothetical protein
LKPAITESGIPLDGQYLIRPLSLSVLTAIFCVAVKSPQKFVIGQVGIRKVKVELFTDLFVVSSGSHGSNRSWEREKKKKKFVSKSCLNMPTVAY